MDTSQYDESEGVASGRRPWVIAGLAIAVGATIFFTSGSQFAAIASKELRRNAKLQSVPLPSKTLVVGTNSISRFKATVRPGSDAAVASFAFSVVNRGTDLQDLWLYAFTDPGFSQPAVYPFSSDGLIASLPGSVPQGVSRIILSVPTTTPFIIPAGSSRYFDLRGLVFHPAVNAGITTKFDGLAAQTLSVPKPGSFTVGLDSSSPGPRKVPAGSSDVPATVLNFRGRNQPISITQVAFQFDGSNLGALERFTLWDGNVMIGQGVFAGSSTTVVTLPYGNFIIPTDGSKLLTIKVNLLPVGGPYTARVGDTVSINYDGSRPTETKGVGESMSGLIISSTKRDTRAGKITLISP